jgi:hypothetical protein
MITDDAGIGAFFANIVRHVFFMRRCSSHTDQNKKDAAKHAIADALLVVGLQEQKTRRATSEDCRSLDQTICALLSISLF